MVFCLLRIKNTVNKIYINDSNFGSFTASKNIRKSLAIWLEKRKELKAQEDLFIDSSKKTLDNEI